MARAVSLHGMVSRAQMLHAGVTNKVIDARVRNGFLCRVHRSVYRVGPVTGPKAREMAAVLACGAGAAVSGRSAAVLWRMLERAREEAPVEVIVPSRRPLPTGVVVHHVRTVRAAEITTIDNISVTTPARTLYDLAVVGNERDVEHALAEGLLQRIIKRDVVLALVNDHTGRADWSGRTLEHTMIAVADQLAAAAGLAVRKHDGVPAVLVRGCLLGPATAGAERAADMVRAAVDDLFR